VFIGLSFSELIEYTDWERSKWHDALSKQGDSVLLTPAGTQGNGRFPILGDLIRHIFSAEKRYIDRLSDRPMTDTASLSNSSVEALFGFGRESRRDLNEYVKTVPAQGWDVFKEFEFFGNHLKATPRKLIGHVLVHEIRHWAQIATFLRQAGLPGDFHDFLFSPVLGGELKRAPA
jgi:uncharacterized damage-inducible protein DinB